MDARRFLSLVLAIALIVSICPTQAFAAGEEELIFDSIYDAAVFLRDGIVNRSFEHYTDNFVVATIYLSDMAVAGYVDEEGNLDANEIYRRMHPVITAHTGVPWGGDYLERGGSFSHLTSSKTQDHWELTVEWHYDISHEETNEMDTAVAHLLDELNVDTATDYEKVRAIYDWMCLNITYDHTYTYYDAYSALCRRTAVCQGYGLLFYRLCLELGIDCRYCGGYTIDGWGSLGSHGWNIVCIDGEWYYVDTTWGAGLINGEPDYYYFLKGINGLGDHLIVESRWENEIGDYCTVAAEDYPIPEKSIVVTSGYVSDTIYFELTKARVLSITGTGTLEHEFVGFNDYVAEVSVGEGIVSIGCSAFDNMSLAAMYLPDSLTSIASDSMPILSHIDLPKNLVHIEPGALAPRALDSITIDPENPYFTVVDQCLFTKDMKTLVCYAGILDNENDMVITEYHVPEGVETIGVKAFEQQDVLQRIVLPNTVRYIENYAFNNCTYAAIQLPDSIVSFGDYAMNACNANDSIYIGEHVSHIGKHALVIDSLNQIDVHPNNQHFVCVDGVLFNMEMTELIRYPVNRPANTYVIPDSVTQIAAGAFAGFDSSLIHSANLEQVVFPDSLATIGEYAFSYQSNIQSLDLPDGLEVIEEGAFVNLSKLQSLVLPDSLKTIGAYAFEGLSKVEEIVIPDGVQTIGKGAFVRNCATTITIGNGLESLGFGAFVRCDYVEGEDNPVINVYFNGLSPEITDYDDGTFALIFGYEDFHSEMVTLYYPYEYRYSWAPNGEGYWRPERHSMWNRYKLVTYENIGDCCYEIVVTESTCTDGGYTTHTCVYCGDNYVDTYTDAQGHYIDGDHLLIAPSCTAEGIHSGMCIRCDTYCNMPVPPLGHNMGDWVTTIKPTTITEGEKTRTCQREGCTYTETEKIPVLKEDQLVDGWIQETGEWYYYQDGTPVTGWLKDGGYWFYLDADGVMQTGWVKVNGNWFYMNKSGVMMTGWVSVGGKWYYMASGGAMQTGWITVNGSRYHLDSKGVMQTGWQQLNGSWYYFSKGGVMQTGWVYDGGYWYYMNSAGVMQKGWVSAGGKWYYMNKSGVMQTGWVQDGGYWYYMDSKGVMVTGTQVIGGKTYIFNDHGVWIG